MYATRLSPPRTVTGDGEGIVSHAGLQLIAETADLTGLTRGLSDACEQMPQRLFDPGVTLAQTVLTLADGGTCLSDLAVLGNQPTLFGEVPSEATVWRTFNNLGPTEFAGIDTARRAARTRAWDAGAGTSGDEVIIDLDATLITTKANKQDAAPTWKRTYGHHPLLAICAETGEVLAATTLVAQNRSQPA